MLRTIHDTLNTHNATCCPGLGNILPNHRIASPVPSFPLHAGGPATVFAERGAMISEVGNRSTMSLKVRNIAPDHTDMLMVCTERELGFLMKYSDDVNKKSCSTYTGWLGWWCLVVVPWAWARFPVWWGIFLAEDSFSTGGSSLICEQP